MKKTLFCFLSLTFFSLSILGCSGAKHPLTESSHSSQKLNYSSFAEYLAQTKEYIEKNRYFISNDKDAELVANMPMEVKPKNGLKPTKAVLLIHGLGDSPFSYVDIAQSLAQQNYLVRTILLAGHGTRPGDMLNVSYEDWNKQVAKQVALLKEQVNDIYLGGYSTGGNLAYSYAANDESIRGLMLFAPAFVPNSSLAFLTPVLSKIHPWILGSKPKHVTNYTRYYKTPTNGFAQYYKTAKAAVKQMEKNVFTRPVFMVLSEHDNVLNSKEIKKLFARHFNNPSNKLVWFGSRALNSSDNNIFINSYDESFRVHSMSHLGFLFKTNNPYYGRNGSERICSTSANDNEFKLCKTDENIWFGAWGVKTKYKIYARLTFNPWYQTMMDELNSTFITLK